MQKKGSLSGAAAQNKLYAIGGGNGINVFSDVEMFDPILGRWIPVQSMHERVIFNAAWNYSVLPLSHSYDLDIIDQLIIFYC